MQQHNWDPAFGSRLDDMQADPVRFYKTLFNFHMFDGITMQRESCQCSDKNTRHGSG